MDQQRPAAAVMCFQHAKTRFLWSFLINVSCFYHSPQLISSRAENRNRRMFGAVVVSGASGRKTLVFLPVSVREDRRSSTPTCWSSSCTRSSEEPTQC